MSSDPPGTAACCVDDDGPFEADEDGYCVGCGTRVGVPTADDFPNCPECQLWEAAGASWPRPCKKHYGGEPRKLSAQ